MDKPVAKNIVWDKAELLDRKDLEKIQLERLCQIVDWVAHVPFYHKVFHKMGLTGKAIQSLEDIRKLPFTTKDDLRDHYPLGFLAVPRNKVLRYHGSSGTTGKPTFVAYTRNDLELWANLCARFLVSGGLLPEHTVQIAFGYGLFTGGFGLHYGIEKVGAGIIPAASGNSNRQLLLMQDLQTDVLVCTPSYALRLAEVIKEEKLASNSLALKFAHLGAEPWSEDIRSHIERELDILAFNNYGLSEVIGPGVSGECVYRDGMHIQEDHFLVECIDPETLEPVPPGEQGELVFTALTKEAFPLLRYRTRDIASVNPEPCACGRTTVRMSRITGRTDDMLIIRGVNVFPSQIEEALLKVKGTAPHYQIIVERPGSLDTVTVNVEMSPSFFSDRMSDLQALRDNIIREIQIITGIQMQVNLVQPQTLERFTGKAKRVIDNRGSLS